MRKSILALSLEVPDARRLRDQPGVTRDAAIGGVGGAAVGAVVPGVSVIEGAAVGAAIGGLAGAVWTDNNNDGYVDGYAYNGQYYAGTPQGYDPSTTAFSPVQPPALSAARLSDGRRCRPSRASAS